MRTELGVIIGNELFSPQGVRISAAPSEEPRAVETYEPHRIHAPHLSTFEEITAHIATAVRLTRGLPPDEARRVRDVFHAASSMLMATTYLEKDDQAAFERALRNA